MKPAQLAAWYAALLLALAWPVLAVDVPVGVDTLAHIARIYVRAHVGTDPDLARLFAVQSTLLPYLGLDWLLTPPAGLMSPLLLVRILTILLVWGTVGATAVLARVITGRVGPEPLAAGLIAWNGAIAWGFLNYVLGHILAVLALALWHAARDRPALWRAAVFTSVCAGLYLTHLLALAVYGGLVVIYALVYRRDGRVAGLAVLVGQFVPAAALMAWAAPPVPQGSLGVLYNLPTSVIGAASPVLFRGASGGGDAGYLVLLAAAILAWTLFRRGHLTWHRPLIIMAGIIYAIALAIPVAAVGISWLNLRLPLVAVCLAIAAMRFHGPPVWTAVLAGLVLVRIASVTGTMDACAPHYAELRQAMAVLPRGAVLVPVLERTSTPLRCTALPVYEHIGNLVTLERSGISTDLFTRTMSVHTRGAPADRKAVELADARPADLGRHTLWMHLGGPRRLPEGAEILIAGSFFDLLRINQPD